MDWDSYLIQSKNYKPRDLLVESLRFVQGKKVLDLGAGALNDARYLMDLGFDVLAVDSNANIEPGNVHLEISRFEDFQIKHDEYDLISAQYALPFVDPNSFIQVMNGIKSGLKIGGVFVGQFFGMNDEWSSREKMTFVLKEDLLRVFEGYELIKFLEEEKEGKTAAGKNKHWHLYNVIAKKLG